MPNGVRNARAFLGKGLPRRVGEMQEEVGPTFRLRSRSASPEQKGRDRKNFLRF